MINRLVSLGIAGLFVGLLVVGWQLLDQPVETLRVKSDLSPGERAQVQAILSRNRLGGILSFRIDDLRQTLEEMDWAREIEIKRRWPDTVEIVLTREQPIARWGDDQFVTASSEIVSLPDTYPNLPRFDVALSGVKQTLRVFRLVDQMVSPSSLALEELRQNAYGEWQVKFAQGFNVQLGVDRLGERIERFLRVYDAASADADRTILYVDVRYASGAAVRFADLSAERELLASNGGNE